MQKTDQQKENHTTEYLAMLFLIVWASFMFFGIRLMIDMMFVNLLAMSEFGFLGIVLYIPFIFFGLLVISPVYLLFKKIYSVVTASFRSFSSNKVRLFFLTIFYYGMPLLFATVIAKQVLRNYRTNYHNAFVEYTIAILPIVVILTLDYLYSKILQRRKVIKK